MKTELLNKIISNGLLEFSVFLFTSYIALSILSIINLIHYLRKNSFVDYGIILTSPLAPSISLLAPAHNEGVGIVEHVRSLLSIHYAKLEVIIINDGSTDDSLEKLIKGFQLEPVKFSINQQLPSKPVNAVYKSTNPSFKQLTVVDKVKGGKSDALNAGINISRNTLITCVDVDCILESDAILKMVKHFIEPSTSRVIATGGVIRIANSCEIKNGQIVKVHVPKDYLPRAQTLEYIRAFLISRMAWSKLNGLLLISGAFGMFDKEILIKAGGYNTNIVGEDMELVVRMRRYMHEIKVPYRVAYIPDPLCWTEAPATVKMLGRQRGRWTRGIAQTLLIHKKLFFNPRYRILGLLSYPYWLIFEWLTPIVEVFGFIYFLIMMFLDRENSQFFLLLLGGVYSFSIMYSMFAILYEEISYRQYKKLTDILQLMLTALSEPFIYHPLHVYWALKGNFELLRGKKDWGVMVREGFTEHKEEEQK